MLPDIDSLVLFVKAADLRNLTRAAEACFITVPAASRRLSLLEHQFMAKLFERHSRGLQLTPAGEHLLKHAHEVIAMINLMRAEMSNYAHGRSAVLRILGNTSAMALFLPSDIASFQARHEAVRVVLAVDAAKGHSFVGRMGVKTNDHLYAGPARHPDTIGFVGRPSERGSETLMGRSRDLLV